MLGDNLKKLRKERNLIQQEVADFLKVKRVTYTQYELQKREPDNEMLQQLAKFYGVTTDFLLGDNNQSAPFTQQKKPKDLAKILEQHDIMFKDFPLNDEDKEDIKNILEIMYTRAKQLNKRKKD